jgi:hypothetical protein
LSTDLTLITAHTLARVNTASLGAGLTLSAGVEHAPRYTHPISAEGGLGGAALATLIETEALITATPCTTLTRLLINATVTVVIDVVASLRGRGATGATLITHALVDHAIAVVVDQVTDLRHRLHLRHTAGTTRHASPRAYTTAT